MAETQSGDPGRTPGSAEGDSETIEQDLNEKGLNQNPESSSQPNAQDSQNAVDHRPPVDQSDKNS